MSNLKKVLKAIVDYLSDVHGLELDSFIPDVNDIGEKQDEEQMGRLLQLVLGIAIHCDGKEGYISYIMFLFHHMHPLLIVRIYSDYTFNGGVCSTRCHGSHPTPAH